MILLNRTEVRRLLTLRDCIGSVEEAFAAHAHGDSLPPVLSHVEAPGGEFHLKAGGLRLGGRTYFVLKANGGFFANPKRFNLPAIQGLVLLSDAKNGSPLAVMDSGEITALRTGASTAVAAKYLARPESSVITICGCGRQGRIQLRALREVLPIKRAFAWTRNHASASAFAAEMSAELKIEVAPIVQLGQAALQSDVIVTCTPANEPFLFKAMIRPGTFIAAVGADSPTKQELDPALVAASGVMPDLLEQAAEVGEWHHAIVAGLVKKDQIRGELSEVIVGKKPGRLNPEEITIFDSTGTALQDAAAAIAVYLRAQKEEYGLSVDLAK